MARFVEEKLRISGLTFIWDKSKYTPVHDDFIWSLIYVDLASGLVYKVPITNGNMYIWICCLSLIRSI
jgi:hypothetical protein